MKYVEFHEKNNCFYIDDTLIKENINRVEEYYCNICKEKTLHAYLTGGKDDKFICLKCCRRVYDTINIKLGL